MSAPHFGQAVIPGTVSFQTFERLLSLRAFETFLFGTAIDLHLLRQSFRQGVINLILRNFAFLVLKPKVGYCFTDLRVLRFAVVLLLKQLL